MNNEELICRIPNVRCKIRDKMISESELYSSCYLYLMLKDFKSADEIRRTTFYFDHDNHNPCLGCKHVPRILNKAKTEKNKEVKNNMDDSVNHPSHYTYGKIEVIDYIEDKELNYHRGNAVKYISRVGKKDPNKEIEDLERRYGI